MWRGTHIGPAGCGSGVVFGSWANTADWLRAMMEVWRPEGVARAMKELRDAPADAPFLTRVGEHLYRIEYEPPCA